ncbi:General stress protein 26 [Devosia sp. YR412]|uniref:pyridoxamine 5'-phosphate oxidase family protein n=1 Tax=Devosia sp. YR412 TaxID=1881030 RepID=UPI0008CB0991|nr:pyridoxamine 5'-phosphate oxidase family protein [Devosia sp. YR412]SEQ02918.1 General stress protein 26 [Devosia sp. YR412]
MTKQQDHSDKTPAEVQDRIWDLAKDIDICMFTTWDGERQRSRPLSARVYRDRHAIYFLVDAEGEKNAQIEKFPFVSAAWVNSGGHKYAVMSGPAKLSNDRALIKELWTDFDKAWWEDEHDPAIRVITLSPEDGELWDSPNRAVAFAKMAVAAVTGNAPDFGDNAKVDL